jgi:hypothetical protein
MDRTRTCESCEYVALSSYSGTCLECTWDNNKQNWKGKSMAGKPTVKEIEEYMAGYNMGAPVLPNTIPSATDKPKAESIEEWKANLIAIAEKGANGMTKEDYNVISKPKHYMLFEDKNIEVRDVIAKLVSKLRVDKDSGMFVADYVQLMQYLMRFMDKNGKEDLKKARWYLDKMIESY